VLVQWFEGPIDVIPAVDVLGEGAVRLHRGDYDSVVAEAGDPAELAAAFRRAGASRVHLVDLDGARSGRVRPELVRLVATAAAPALLQASGGIRSLADAETLIAAGADRVVVGTAAFPDPAGFVAALGDRLIVALDVRDGLVRTSGWTIDSGLTRERAVELCLAARVERVLCTAIDRDGTLGGPDLELVAAVACSGLRVIAAGGVRSRADVRALADAGAEAAVVGRAVLGETTIVNGS
jgi:phosphoribosylformimino-5-aminoimidazole carboxamide ribotide isomerase